MSLPEGVTCVECLAVGWADCGTARDVYCVASDRVDADAPLAATEVQEALW